MDDLIERLRARAADPDRRTTFRPSVLDETVGSLDLGGLVAMGRDLAGSLRQVVAANQAGLLDEAGVTRAGELELDMTTPAAISLPAPASEAAIARAEAELGVRLPVPLRRIYMEVADGGFGPGEGLLPLHGVVPAYRELRAPGRMPRGRSWPQGLLPVVRVEPGYDCVDAADGRVVAFDPEELSERSSEERFRRAFSEVAPSVEAWLTDWVGSKTHAEESADRMAELTSHDSQVRMAREARATIAKLSPEERASLGLPDVGWERVVWGGLGWDEDDAGRGDG